MRILIYHAALLLMGGACILISTKLAAIASIHLAAFGVVLMICAVINLIADHFIFKR